HLQFKDLNAAFGGSDIQGTLTIDARFGRPSRIRGELRSQRLRLSDLGARAAGRDVPGTGPDRLLLPTTPIRLTGSRDVEADVRFEAQTVEVGRVALQSVAGQIKVDHGRIDASPISASVAQGRLMGDVSIDVTRDVPAIALDLR